MESNSSKKRLLKLLMLHGYRQNEKSFRERTGGLRKSLRNHAEFIFCSAPNEIPLDESRSALDQATTGEDAIDQRGWWFSDTNRSYNALEKSDTDLGFQESLSHVNEIFQMHGPFDGVFAFSQGACLAAMLCRIAADNNNVDANLNEYRQKYKAIKFRFAVLVAGFKSGQSQHQVFFEKQPACQMPTLHVIGDTDKVIPSERSIELLEFFDKPHVFRHTGGHFVPVNAEAKNTFIEFFNQVSN